MKLFNPGPTNVSRAVRNAIRTEDLCHREDEVKDVVEQVKSKLLKVLNTTEHQVIPFVSSATGCNEAIIASIYGKALVINNGKYAERLKEMVQKYDIPCKEIKDYRNLEKNLKGVTHVLMVHHETTTGEVLPLKEISAITKKHGKVLVVDAVSSIGGHEFNIKNVDFCTVSANKCLQGFPGISFVIAKQIPERTRSFYFDMAKTLPFTIAVQLFFALNKALDELLKEGVENRIKRYKNNADILRKGLKKKGYEFYETESNVITVIKMPKGFDYWRFHNKLKSKGMTIYSDKNVLGKGLFRIATMGNIKVGDIKKLLKYL